MPSPSRPRPDYLSQRVHPTTRFFWGLGLLSCLVFSGGWEARSLLAVLGLGLAVASGKRINLGYFAFLVGSVVVFNIFLPLGKVWFQIGPWAVTEGAFLLGLGKGMTFAGLVFFSLASISRHLSLPGRFGSLWARTFAWYEQLIDQRTALKPRALLLSVDRLLERLYPTRPGTQPNQPKESVTSSEKTKNSGWLVIGLTLTVALGIVVVLK